MRHPFFQRSLNLGLLAAFAALMVTLTACDDDLTTSEAQLVAPPGVSAPVHRGRAHVTVHLETIEKDIEIAPGVRYRVWTFNGSVPGPMIRVREGDTVDVLLRNNASSEMTHNIDLHSVNGPGGGAGATTVKPGEEKQFTFKALAPGLYVYHCATGIVADHIGNGMYGAILVEPKAGLPPVDREYYIAQGEYYTTGDTGERGPQEQDSTKLLAEQPTYVVFNGDTKAVSGEKSIRAETGERVRLFVANGGPNFTSSFHVIGEIFDDVYSLGSFGANGVLHDVQTVSVPPGGAVIVDFTVDVPGDYKLVDHAISRVSKGALGTLSVTGKDNFKVFRAGAPGADSGHHMAPTAPAGSTGPVVGTAGQSVSVKVTMKDNSFTPKDMNVAAGAKVTFELPNEGKAIHNMRIADANGSYASAESKVSEPELIAAGKAGKLIWDVPNTPGVVYTYQCDIHPDAMVGTLSVK